MNKKLKFIVAGVAIVAGLASAVSCQDLKTDLDNLGKRVSTLESTVKDLQSKIDAGAVITSVTSTATGVKVTLSNGNSFDIANGKDGANGTNGKDGINGTNGLDGAPGTVVTIGENGNWYLDGVDTGLKAAGKDGKDGIDGKDGKDGIDGKDGKDGIDGKDGKDGIDGKDGKDGIDGKDGKDGIDGDSIYWTIEDGKFVEYKNGEKTGNEVSFAEAGQLYAVWADDMITFYNVWDPETETYISTTVYTSSFTPDVEIAAISLVDTYTGYYEGYPAQGNSLTGRIYWGRNTVYYLDAATGSWMPFQTASGEDVFVYGGSINKNSTSVDFTNVIAKANKFGPNGEMEFVEGEQIGISDYLLVRVSPANYQLKAEDIKFISSKGDVFDQIEVTAVEPADDVVITRGSEANGLWYVHVALKEYDKEAFEAANYIKNSWGGTNQLLFAMKAQEAISTYDIAFNYSDFQPRGYLRLMVGGTKWQNRIEQFNNRPYNSYTRSTKAGNDYGQYKEMQWADQSKPAVAAITKGDKKNVEIFPDDNYFDERGGRNLYNAVLGETIPIYAWYTTDGAGNYLPDQYVAGIYVTFDYEANAIESAPSEWNAWKSYEKDILGLNTLFAGPAAAIQINSKAADGDVIGFRVYAVNADGTLIDPDGRAFYVQLGKDASALDAINTVISTREEIAAKQSANAKVAENKTTGVQYVQFTLDDTTAPEFTVTVMDKDKTPLATMQNGYGYGLDVSKIALAYTNPTTDVDGDGVVDLWAYEDDATYTGTLTFYGENNRVLATQQVTFTKNLPTKIDLIPVKTSQLGADGKYRCFLVPDQWTAFDTEKKAFEGGQFGTIDMLSIFNFPKDDPNGYEVTFAGAKYTYEDENNPAWDERVKKDGNYVMGDITVVPTKKLSEDTALNAAENQLKVIDIDLINGTTEHTTTVALNYGPVSSKLVEMDDNGNITGVKDYKVTANSFQTIFFCIYNDVAGYDWPWSWKFSKTADVTFNGAVAKSAKIAKNTNMLSVTYEDFDGGTLDPTYITGYSTWDSLYKGTMPTGYNNTIKVQDVKLVTVGGANDGKVEYYNVGTDFKFTKKSGATNPTNAVPSSLVITYTDMYGHKNVTKLPAEVLHR